MKFTRIESAVLDEFIQAKAWEQYISEYTGRKMDFRKGFNLVIGAAAIIGSFT